MAAIGLMKQSSNASSHHSSIGHLSTSMNSGSSSNNNNNNNQLKMNQRNQMIVNNCTNMQQNQLTRSLERILEDAHLSGELKLSGRKLKDFPKAAAGKYNLNDTVIADLSRNRFCELPDDITCFPFLETLLMYHNTLRSIPDSVRGLHSLSYLDLRSNQLSVLPREVCLLPLQVLLISNNRLVSLPDELGRMDQLTELDAACNQITNLPSRMSDLKSLRSLSLRNNQLVYLPREVTCLHLVTLDISGNRIATLPVELRNMTSLVNLELENNPLTSPPASLCVRGLVHVFKYLDIMANKEERNKSGSSVDGHHNTTLRRTLPKQTSSCSNNGGGGITTNIYNDPNKSSTLNNRRQHVDSGYSTSDGLDKRWSQEMSSSGHGGIGGSEAKWSPTPIHIRTNLDHHHHQHHQPQHGSGGPSTPLLSPQQNAGNGGNGDYDSDELKHNDLEQQRAFNNGGRNSNEESPDGGDYTPDSQKSDEKIKSLGNVQTYREYKEALRQQRNQDSSSIYRTKDQITPPDSGSPDSPINTYNKSRNSSPSPTNYASHHTTPTHSNSSPIHHQNHVNQSPQHHHQHHQHHPPPHSPHHSKLINKTNSTNGGGHQNGSGGIMKSQNGGSENNGCLILTTNQNEEIFKKSGQKQTTTTTTSRNSNATYQSPTNWTINGNHQNTTIVEITTKELNVYVKPSSPTKCGGGGGGGGSSQTTLGYNNVPTSPSTQNGNGKETTNDGSGSTTMKTTTKRTVSWNRDIPNEKLSFTMRREFDKQKEETELIEQLRKIIESRLKMALPNDIASALTDGVVLCHLANQVKPRSVASIHVPSPAVPKLTMARCRRNVDNFLNACRHIGVDEELICSCADIVPTELSSSILDNYGSSPSTSTATTATKTSPLRPSLPPPPPPVSTSLPAQSSPSSSSLSSSSPPSQGNHHDAVPNLLALYQTVIALHELDLQIKQNIATKNNNNHDDDDDDYDDEQNDNNDDNKSSFATNTKTSLNYQKKNKDNNFDVNNDDNQEEDDYEKYFKKCGIRFQKSSIIQANVCSQSSSSSTDVATVNTTITTATSSGHNSTNIINQNDKYTLNNSSMNINNNFYNKPNNLNSNFSNSGGNSNITNGNNTSNIVKRRNNNFNDELNNEENDGFYNNSIDTTNSVLINKPPSGKIRKAPQTLDLTSSKNKKRKLTNVKRSFGNGQNGQLIGIIEECEYDSDIGKFNCDISGVSDGGDSGSSGGGTNELTTAKQIITSDTGNTGSSSIDFTNLIEKSKLSDMNDAELLNGTPKQQEKQLFSIKNTDDNIENLNNDNENGGDASTNQSDNGNAENSGGRRHYRQGGGGGGGAKIVMKRIEFFENVDGTTGTTALTPTTTGDSNLDNDNCVNGSKSSISSSTSTFSPCSMIKTTAITLNNLMCCAADVLEGKGAVQVAITVTELLRFHNRNHGSNKLLSPKIKSPSTVISTTTTTTTTTTTKPPTPPPPIQSISPSSTLA